jgi:hypothetical protein
MFGFFSICEIRRSVIWAKFDGEFEFRGPRACGLHRILGNHEIVIWSTKLGRKWVGIRSMWGLVLEVKRCVF